MALYNLYAGMSGGFGGYHYHDTEEFETHEDATEAARQLAIEEYESYEGSNGILDWNDCAKEVLEEMGVFDLEDDVDFAALAEEFECTSDVDERYQEEIEGWISYLAILEADDPEKDQCESW